ncbi:hypothetical protein [Croceibacterium salegens]|uniref:hypothetical protein n=1 Tax=Croceibacterium salegens TaxID=1737568 RepID=UPI0019168EA2|nr:hypothetical protein [Croceibacterium salegens]
MNDRKNQQQEQGKNKPAKQPGDSGQHDLQQEQQQQQQQDAEKRRQAEQQGNPPRQPDE